MRYNKYMNNTPLTAALLVDLLSNVDDDTIIGFEFDGLTVAIDGIRFTTDDEITEHVVVNNYGNPGFVFEL